MGAAAPSRAAKMPKNSPSWRELRREPRNRPGAAAARRSDRPQAPSERTRTGLGAASTRAQLIHAARANLRSYSRGETRRCVPTAQAQCAGAARAGDGTHAVQQRQQSPSISMTCDAHNARGVSCEGPACCPDTRDRSHELARAGGRRNLTVDASPAT